MLKKGEKTAVGFEPEASKFHLTSTFTCPPTNFDMWFANLFKNNFLKNSHRFNGWGWLTLIIYIFFWLFCFYLLNFVHPASLFELFWNSFVLESLYNWDYISKYWFPKGILCETFSFPTLPMTLTRIFCFLPCLFSEVSSTEKQFLVHVSMG